MGCAQSKPPTSQSSPSGGVDGLKLDGRYLPGAAADADANMPQPPRGPAERRERVRVADAGAVRRGGGRRERERVGRDDGAAEKTKTTMMAMATPPSRGGGEAEEMVVDGWPRWLLENIPREVLSGLVPRSADSYDKIDKFFSTNPLACDLSGLPVIYKEDKDDYTHLRDGRKRKSSKLKQRSYKQKEDAKKIEAAMARRKADSGSSKEEEKPTDVRVQIQEIGSSIASTSSSVTKPKRYAVVPGESLYPGSYLPQEISQRSDAHPSASKNIKNFPPLAAIEEVPGGPKGRDIMHRYGLDRSISMSEFRRMDGKDLSKLYVLVD